MSIIKKAKIIFIVFGILFSRQLLAANEPNNGSVNEKLMMLQDQINQLKANIKTKKINKNNKLYLPLVQTNPLIAKMLSSSGSAYFREHLLLDAIKKDKVQNNHYYVGGKIEALPSYNWAIPNGNQYNSEANLFSQARLGALARVSSWLTGFYSLQGQANGNLSVVNKEIYLLANNGKTPFYLILGTKYVDFGSFKRFSVVINPLNRVFWISSDVSQIEGGYYSQGLNLQLTAFNGNSTTNTNSNQIANNAETIFYQFNLASNAALKVGGAYINGINQSASLSNSTSVQLAANQRTPAFDTFMDGGVKINNNQSISYGAEYTQTVDSTNQRNTSAWLLAGMYKTSFYKKVYKLYANYSALNALTGHYNQYLVGGSTQVLGVVVGLDYALLTASELRNDQMVEFKFEYSF